MKSYQNHLHSVCVNLHTAAVFLDVPEGTIRNMLKNNELSLICERGTYCVSVGELLPFYREEMDD